MNITTLILFGFFGGIIRAGVGLLKNKVFIGKEKFNGGKFWVTVGISGLVGLFCALMTIEDYRIALLAGYAGSDFIQGMYRIGKER